MPKVELGRARLARDQPMPGRPFEKAFGEGVACSPGLRKDRQSFEEELVKIAIAEDCLE